MEKDDRLILSKLHIPYIRPKLVARPHLQAQIEEGIRGPLTLVTAPAGFGKTTLVASSLANCGTPVAWLSLDRDDNQAGRFLRYLTAALNAADNHIGNEAGQLMVGMSQIMPETILTSLINDLDSRNQEIVLVLDDYHLINSREVHEIVGFLLEHIPNNFHLVIAGRSDPSFPLSRLRGRGQAYELRSADLRFSEPEAVQFLNDVMGLRLKSEAVEVLEARTEGWIAGLQLAAISIRDRDDMEDYIRKFAGTNRYIMDFMLEEVLARESEDVQAFLIQTSVLIRLCGPLCDVVTGTSSSQEMLERLEKDNLFILPLDDDRCWYRYHHLFADLLQARLYQSGPEQPAKLLMRAARWCEKEGHISDAIGYAMSARDYSHAGDMLVNYWAQIANRGEIETVWTWINALPEESVRNNAPLTIVYCWMLYLMGRIGEIEKHLVDGEHAMMELVEKKDTHHEVIATLPAELATLRSFVARYQQDFEGAISLSEQALRLLPGNLPPFIDMQLRTVIYVALAAAYEGAGDLEKAVSAYSEANRLSCLGSNYIGIGITIRLAGALRVLGRLRAAEAACRDALAYVQTRGMARLPSAGILHVAMSEVLVEQNDLEAAELHLTQGIELGKRSGRLDALKNAAYALSRLRQARKDLTGALSAIQEAEFAFGEQPPPLASAELLSHKARVLIRSGSLNEAARCVEQAAHLVGKDRGQTGEMAALAASRLVAALGRPGETIAKLGQAIDAAESNNRFGSTIELCILRSLLLARVGNIHAAYTDLERALVLAEPEGYVRIFLDEGEPAQKLLSQWFADPGVGPMKEYAAGLLSQFETEKNSLPADKQVASLVRGPSAGSEKGPVEPLSPRELEVLQLIASGKTNQEIARVLFVAPGTVKAHTANIFRKLDVRNRTEAVAQARQFDVLT